MEQPMTIHALPKQLVNPINATIALETVQQSLLSMALLTQTEQPLEDEAWLAEITPHLSPAQIQMNRLIFGELADLFTGQQDAETFPAYLAALATLEPTRLAARIEQLGDSPTAAKVQPLIHELPTDPAALQAQFIDHLRVLWQQHFAAAWEKKYSMLCYIRDELTARDWPTSSASALIRAFIRRPLPEWLANQLGGVTRIILVPSPFLQLQAARGDDPATLWLFLWADFWLWPMRTEPIQRSELLSPINALADETRLHILELLAASDELRAQEIIAQVAVGQSTVSRHLKQLVRAGFISEERAGDTNKIYRLQQQRIGEVTYSLSQLLSAENARLVFSDVRLTEAAALRPFLDRDGLVTTWPAKQKGQDAVLAYLQTKFTIGEEYTEAAVNERLSAWHSYGDPAYLRRSLVEAALLKRTADGSSYWREA